MTETEPEWSDHDRGAAMALDIYEDGICRCGHHVSLTNDTANGFEPTDRVCKVCAALAVHGRMQDVEDQAHSARLGDEPHPKEPRPGDGRYSFVRLLTPAEKAERERRRDNG